MFLFLSLSLSPSLPVSSPSTLPLPQINRKHTLGCIPLGEDFKKIKKY